MYSFPNLKPVCCSMSGSNCCFLTCIQVSQEAGKVVWYSHLFKNFPQFVVIHTVKGFSVVNEAEVINIQSHHFMANRWVNNGNSDRLIFLDSRITADGYCSHEIKRCLLLGRNALANLDSTLKSKDITLPTKVCLVKAMDFQQ